MRPSSGKFYLTALLVALSVFALSFTARTHTRALQIGADVSVVTAPVENVLAIAGHRVAGVVAYVDELLRMRQENAHLRAEVQSLQARLATQTNASGEVGQLKKLLSLKQQNLAHQKTHSALVIGRAPSDWFNTVTINAGSDAGVRRGDPVLGAGGIAGTVVSVAAHTSRVMLLPDPESSVGARVAGSGDAGVLSGTGKPDSLKLEFFSSTVNVKRGDVVVTSGLGNTGLPAGLPLGQVMSVHRGDFGLVVDGVVQPYVNFNRLDTVLVVIGPSS